MSFSFYDFFSGGGMVSLGLGPKWNCLFANDFDKKKALVFRENFPKTPLIAKDINDLNTSDIPQSADLSWASFPCQDLSLAGSRKGLKGERSGTFWPFWNLMKGLVHENRAPKLLVLENVAGTVTSHNGKDFTTIISSMTEKGYLVGALVIDAVHFVPQSRPRLFIIGVRKNIKIPRKLICSSPQNLWETTSLLTTINNFPPEIANKLVWFNLPAPPKRNIGLSDIIEEIPTNVRWHTSDETQHILKLMDVRHREKVDVAKTSGNLVWGAVYRRTRPNGDKRIQRAEVRFDNISGCLRTPSGGSSRQTLLMVRGNEIKSRLLSPREAARLMGIPENYKLPHRYNEAYHLAGDGVVVPVVAYLANHLFEPVLEANQLKAVA